MYKKSINWYISRELRPLSKKIEAYINKKGSPKVKLRVQNDSIFVIAPYYAKFQDKGVKGVDSGHSTAKPAYSYGKNGMPPAVAFERYTSDITEQFKIARAIYKKGIKPKKYIDKSFGHFAPQIAKAIDRGITKYTDIEIFNIK